ncbi:uracil-DNA glycosylase [Noviherbaspirillum saxi]|uniref:Type-4 uracil-DNA glycosylase n=1 Tax=Noviherbaspirillum saxi TaxID=2320863 RepID=A0A3A3FRH9_9BURK|nr:uracil-DNA glycosylase [Noviherbaspirillum saxi]RJF98443.1 uracil-DNA glycosylase [Noviherbaspirillum saxi]
MTANVRRRAAFIDEMGIGPLWSRRNAPETAAETALQPDTAEPAVEVTKAFAPVMEAWPEETATLELQTKVTPQAPPAREVAHMDWVELKTSVAGCVKCGLCQGRTNTVFGVGDEKAKWLFIGEGPGRNEDLQGEPFVGQAGKLLDNMLRAVGLRRGENAYIANIVKCRPTDANGKDRPPTAAETAACLPYLERQIALIQPSVLVALGKTAALSLLALDPDTPVSRLRGKVHRYADRPLIVTYHPAYLLRNMIDKRKAWEDLSLAMTTYAGLD